MILEMVEMIYIRNLVMIPIFKVRTYIKTYKDNKFFESIEYHDNTWFWKLKVQKTSWEIYLDCQEEKREAFEIPMNEFMVNHAKVAKIDINTERYINADFSVPIIIAARKNNFYEILAGRHRYRKAKDMNKPTLLSYMLKPDEQWHRLKGSTNTLIEAKTKIEESRNIFKENLRVKSGL